MKLHFCSMQEEEEIAIRRNSLEIHKAGEYMQCRMQECAETIIIKTERGFLARAPLLSLTSTSLYPIPHLSIPINLSLPPH